MHPERNSGKPAKIGFIKARDVIIIGCLALAAAIIWVIVKGGGQGNRAAVVIGSGKEQTTQTIDLAKNQTLYIQGKIPVQLEVKDGAVRFINSVCPDHRCEGFGWLRKEGDWAACLPAQVVVTVE